MRLQHYELLFDAVLKRIPELEVLLAHFQTLSGSQCTSHKGLGSKVDPGEYRRLLRVTLLTLERAKLPLETPALMTERAWADGWDETMRNSGEPPKKKSDNRCLLLGNWIHFLLAIMQWICPICLERLLRPHDLRDMPAVRKGMLSLHFDHFIFLLKHSAVAPEQYIPGIYWYKQPMVMEFNLEKRSGCWVHIACHNL
jgi:hypothetical protein